jgi:hypothetical protein
MQLNLPPKVRKAIYIAVVMGSAVMIPLDQFDAIPDVVMAVWVSVSGAASLLAAFNVPKPN